MTARIQQCVPVVLASLVLIGGSLALGIRSYEMNDDHLVYALDDPYIHMAMAKNLVIHGVWGITPYEFSSSTSSPIWVLALAGAFKLFGVHALIPGALAAACSVVALVFADLMCRELRVQSLGRRTAASLLLVWFTPLLPMIATGMEHCLHIGCVLALFYFTAVMLRRPTRLGTFGLCCAACIASGVRYESLFVVVPIAALFCLRKQFRVALLTLVCSAMPIVLYGSFSIAHGGDFLPNSLLLKGAFPQAGGFMAIANALGYRSLRQITLVPHLFALCILLIGTALFFHRRNKILSWFSAIVVVTILIHCQLASAGWFYRYEAYLMAAGIVVLSIAWLPRIRIPELKPPTDGFRLALAALLVLLLLWPLNQRACLSLRNTALASHNIYEQQYQIGTFFAQALDSGCRIAMNDVGAATYLADFCVLDLYGLGSDEVTSIKKRGQFDTRAIERLFVQRHVEYVIVYDSWFTDASSLPSGLVRVADWTIADNFVCGSDRVSFYGTSPASARRLSVALRRFAPRLPKTVAVQWSLLRGEPGASATGGVGQ